MKNPTKSKLCVLGQLCKFIPGHLTAKLAKKHGVDKRSRSFSPWSHVVSLLYAQLVHAIGLNDVCDSLRHHAGKLSSIRGATVPSRNGLSHANKVRDPKMMQDLFWKVLDYLKSIQPKFGYAGRYKGIPRRFKRTIHAVDSSTISLVANCMDWAKHRRRKAAAKCHMRLNLHSFLPSFIIVEQASHHDDYRAQELCAGLQAGEIVLFDKAYINYEHLYHLTKRDVFWVTRAKDNMDYHVCKRRIKKQKGNIIRDDEVTLSKKASKKNYPQRFRRIEALVEVDGKLVTMVFISNNLEWAPSSVCELYLARWGIEVFFKQIKQTLQVCDFLGHSKNAIQWQLYAALLVYVLLRFQAFLSGWQHSFTRIFTLTRSAVWDKFELLDLLQFYGTAGGKWRMRTEPQTLYLPGFKPPSYGTAHALIA